MSTKIACVSDIHGKWKSITYPKADVLVFAGDILRNYSHNRLEDSKIQLKELAKLDRFLGHLKEDGVYKHVVFVCGNHDWVFEKLPIAARASLTNAIYLQDQEVVIDGIKFYGSPWQTWFCDWAFNFPNHHENFFRARAFARKVWKDIPDDTNVLITHGPAQGILDECWDGRKVGCDYLKERLQRLMQLRLHIFGHIHTSYGTKAIDRTQFVNAAACGEDYVARNPIQTVEI